MDYPKSVPGIGLVDGRFVDADPVTGRVGSWISAMWANSMMSELLAVLAHAGIEPDEDVLNQLVSAIWKPAALDFAGVAALASVLEAKAGEDGGKIITPATLKAVLQDFRSGIPGATFAELDAATSDQGPAICTDMGGYLYKWVETAYFSGYRNVRIGELPDSFATITEPWWMPMTGGVWSEADPKQRRLIAWFREQGQVMAAIDWAKGWGRIADLGGGDWKAVDAQDGFKRYAGTDADTANPMGPGEYQADALQNITGTSGPNASYYDGGNSAPDGAFALGARTTGAGAGTNPVTRSGFTFDASRVARTSSETRSAATRVLPVVLI